MLSEGSHTKFALSWLLLLLSLVSFVTSMALDGGGKSEYWPSSHMNRPPPTSIRACGSDLDRAVSLACSDRGYNTPRPYRNKRSTDTELYNLIFRRHSDSIRLRNKRQNIVNECCYQTCSWETILEYCA